MLTLHTFPQIEMQKLKLDFYLFLRKRRSRIAFIQSCRPLKSKMSFNYGQRETLISPHKTLMWGNTLTIQCRLFKTFRELGHWRKIVGLVTETVIRCVPSAGL
jgi:hypothetical protein